MFALLLATGPVLGALDAGSRPPPVFVDGGKPDQTEGARILGDFRQAGIMGDYWLAFDLQVLPRRGAERTIAGEMFGTRGSGGPLTRLNLGAGHWLIQSGSSPAAWTIADGAVHQASTAEILQPLAGTDFTLFDLQMPFLQWPDFAYEGLAKVRSRPAHRFLLYPPAEFAAARPELGGVRVAIDTQFQAVVQVEQLGRDGRPTRSVTLLGLKKVGEQWLMKSVDLRNLATRDKTRLTFKAAALDLVLPPEIFAPGQLLQAAPPVTRGKIRGL